MTMKEWPAVCDHCGFKGKILAWDYEPLMCPDCGLEARDNPYVKFDKAPGVIGDELNNYAAKHGVCHPDGTPRRFDSKTELYAALNEAGLKISGDTPGKPYRVRWSGKVKQEEKAAPIFKTRKRA